MRRGRERKRSAAGDSGDHGEHVSGADLGVELVEVTDVVVVLVDVDELVEATRLVEQVAADRREAGNQVAEDLPDRRTVARHRGQAVGVRAQHGGQLDLDGHGTRLSTHVDSPAYKPDLHGQ